MPSIAVLGSGGGFRAMVSLSGVFCALKDMGVLDCAMYTSGLSGSAWYVYIVQTVVFLCVFFIGDEPIHQVILLCTKLTSILNFNLLR